MTAILPQLIDSLRHELQQYGEMLALLEAQQDLIVRGAAPPVLISVSALEAQGAAIQVARQSRETCQQQLAWVLGRPGTESFSALLPLLPSPYQPLMTALGQEINELVTRVREQAGHNHAQLRRALALMETFLQTLSPETPSASATGEPSASQAELSAVVNP